MEIQRGQKERENFFPPPLLDLEEKEKKRKTNSKLQKIYK